MKSCLKKKSVKNKVKLSKIIKKRKIIKLRRTINLNWLKESQSIYSIYKDNHGASVVAINRILSSTWNFLKDLQCHF